MRTIHFGWFTFFLGLAVSLGACSSDAGSGGAGGQGSTDFTRLAGDSTAVASTVIEDTFADTPPPAAEFSTDSAGHRVQRTIIKITFLDDTTVGDVNDLLAELSAEIVASLEGYPALVVRIPDPRTLDALETLVAEIASRGIVASVIKSYERPKTTLPPNLFEVFFNFGNPDPEFADEWKWAKHQLAVRGAGAWSVRRAIKQKPKVVVLDEFGDGNPNVVLRDQVYEIEPLPGEAGGNPPFGSTAPDEFGFTLVEPPEVPDNHGYEMLSIIAAEHSPLESELDQEPIKSQLDDQDFITGMVPGGIQLGVVDLQSASTVASDIYLMQLVRDAADASSAPVIVNISRGWDCGLDVEQCNSLDDLEFEVVDFIKSVRHIDAEDRALFVVAAGNVVPPGQADAATQSHWNASTLIDGWIDPITDESIPSLNNVLVVENAAHDGALVPTFKPGCIHESSFVGGHIAGIGRELGLLFAPSRVPVADTKAGGGTSAATAQVSGVAAYVSAMRPDLSPQQLINLLVATAQPPSGEGNGCSSRGRDTRVVDAYASVLATDPPNRVDSGSEARLRLLDITNADNVPNMPDEKFDEHDLVEWVRVLSSSELDDADKLYSRYDLNGDGIAGIEGDLAPFDLDVSMNPSGSEPTPYTAFVESELLGRRVLYDEFQLSDIQIVCYYANSALYELGTGPLGIDVRDNALREVETLCNPAAPQDGLSGTYDVSGNDYDKGQCSQDATGNCDFYPVSFEIQQTGDQFTLTVLEETGTGLEAGVTYNGTISGNSMTGTSTNCQQGPCDMSASISQSPGGAISITGILAWRAPEICDCRYDFSGQRRPDENEAPANVSGFYSGTSDYYEDGGTEFVGTDPIGLRIQQSGDQITVTITSACCGIDGTVFNGTYRDGVVTAASPTDRSETGDCSIQTVGDQQTACTLTAAATFGESGEVLLSGRFIENLHRGAYDWFDIEASNGGGSD